MKNVIKSQYGRIALALLYTAIAIVVYVITAETLWHLWYINLIVGLGLAIIGCVVGYYYAYVGYKDSLKCDTNESAPTQTEEKPVEKE